MDRLMCVVIGYFLGCIQTSYIMGRIKANIDIREHGSGSAGTTNTVRVLGRAAGVIVFMADVAKAFAAYIICSLLFNGGGSFFSADVSNMIPGLYGGLGTVLGHNFPFFMKFKGGKGIAATLGIFLMMDWRAALIIYAIGAIIVAFTHYISLASLTMTLLAPFAFIIIGYTPEVVVVGFILTGMAFYLHRGNIQRLRNGTERKFSFVKKGSASGG